ncbi:hypothetical protein MA16_Dca026899 [Dendrobium catenatum]|uniref:Uncharacterized protein n=1 Tax=Dendrobium catenatum TaxID=906689 RepID=A0A2I0VFI4_9ASPA|nr:hypothetical protein MA16_Dca026899 [Dendrobium catenatum]
MASTKLVLAPATIALFATMTSTLIAPPPILPLPPSTSLSTPNAILSFSLRPSRRLHSLLQRLRPTCQWLRLPLSKVWLC